MLPRWIVALGVGFALLLTLSFVSAAGARSTLIHTGNSGVDNPFTRFAAASGSTLVRTTDSTYGDDLPNFLPSNATMLTKYGCVVLPVNASGIDASRVGALRTYAEGGGTVVLVSEYAGVPRYSPTTVAVLNDVATGMGSTMRFEPTTVDFQLIDSTTSAITADPLTKDVATLGYNATSTIAPGAEGKVLVRASLNEPFVAVDQMASGRLVMLGDSNLIIDNPDQYTPYDNDVFVHNLCGDTSPPDIVIDNPKAGARYKRVDGNTTAKALFHCTDPDSRPRSPFYDDVLYCTGVEYANGAPLDLSVAGAKELTVNAGDKGTPINTKVGNAPYTVDGTPPTPYIVLPEEGGSYDRQGSYFANFGCTNNDNDPIEPTVTASTAPLGGTIRTTEARQESFSVTCTDSVGNSSAPLTHTYAVVDKTPPEITITTPFEKQRFRLNQAVNALYGCTDDDGPTDLLDPGFCTGPVGSGGPIPTNVAGSRPFKVDARDKAFAGGLQTKTNTYFVDASPPDITITVPTANGKYNRNSPLAANYGCSDADTTPSVDDVKSCTGPVGNTKAIDTSAAGTKTFKVDAQDQAGNTATKTNTYIIIGTSPPTVTIASPADGASFKQGAAIPLSYSCADPDGQADIKSCTATRASPLDASKAGTFEITARAEDLGGLTASRTHKYTVVAPGTPASAAAPTKTTSAKVCKSRRKFTIRVKKKKGVKIVSATVFVNGKKIKAKKGKRITSVVTLTGLKKGRYTVVIKAKLSDGRTVTDRRKFKTCTPKGK